MPTVELLPITPSLVAALGDADEFRRACGASLGAHVELVRQVVEQNEAHRARTGAPPEWGGFLAVAAAPDGTSAAPPVVGTCAFVGEPDDERRVEIAYFTFPAFERRGYGAAMAGALLARAAASGAVRRVLAFTLPEPGASTRILERHGFARTGTAVDPDAGTVWRWERPVHTAAP